MDLQKKLEILSDAAKYDVSCSSSGSSGRGDSSSLAILRQAESATAGLMMAAVFPCSKFYLPTTASMTVSTV